MEVVVRRVPAGGGMPPHPIRGQSGPPMTAALRYAIAHPWQSLEHATVIVLFVLYLSTVAQKIPCSSDPVSVPGPAPESVAYDVARTGPVAHCQLAPPEGPDDAFVQPGVYEAALPTILATAKGQVLSHHDKRGDIHRILLGEGISVNLMFTKKGTMRSGDLHNCTQYDVILRGRTRLRSVDLESGEETLVEYDGNYNFIAIPSRVPHLFEFMEDNYMLEWWACDFRAWYYKPLRDIITENMKSAAGRNIE